MKPASLAFMIVAGLAGVSAGGFALLASRPASNVAANTSTDRPVWNEVKWPFPIDQWGSGRAFICKTTDCGTEVKLNLRAKLGSCNCETGVAGDADLDRMSDFDLFGAEVSPVGAGQPITVDWMNGRSRVYSLSPLGRQAGFAISTVFNDRCDMIVATAVLPEDRTEAIQPNVIDFLNSKVVLHWVELAFGI
jgi:hypothetical protein